MDKINSKKATKIVGLLIIFMISVSILCGCSKNNIEDMSADMLNISDNLGYYDEIAKRQQFAIEKDICLAKGGVSDYDIVISSSANEDIYNLATELSGYLNRIIGSSNMFAVVREENSLPGKYISLGETAISASVSVENLKDDGYLIKSVNQNIYIKTIEENALSNGVYGFLENQLECMFVRDDFDYVPSFPTVYLDNLDIVSNPYFAWRKVFQYEVAQNGWYKKLKNNGAVADDIEANNNWGTWCHNVFSFVSPEIYLESHPEYFSIVDGEPKQLCLTNPDVYPIIEAKMQEIINKRPEIKYWDFSLNDNYEYCKCENCNKVLVETGSMMGTMLPIINKLAVKFPDKIISTLAYFYNEKVPTGMTCEENVNIVIAPISTGQLYSYKYGKIDPALKAKEMIESWGEIAHNILIWDYVVNFSHLLLPYPNFDVQKDNHELYKANNVTAVFHQGSREENNELACLRAYTLSQQMWDNNVDINKLLAKYLVVTYGKGAKYVAEYLDRCNIEVKNKADNLDLYDQPEWHRNDYLSSGNNKKYLSLINNAIKSEKDNPIIVSRLEEIKINILYAIMNESGYAAVRKDKAFKEFKLLNEKFNISQPHEIANPTMEEYITDVYPKQLLHQKVMLSVCVIVPILGVILIGIGVIITFKFIKKRKRS